MISFYSKLEVKLQSCRHIPNKFNVVVLQLVIRTLLNCDWSRYSQQNGVRPHLHMAAFGKISISRATIMIKEEITTLSNNICVAPVHMNFCESFEIRTFIFLY